MPDAYLGEIRYFAFGKPPRGWALCDGKILKLSENQALFSLIGSRFGGDGISTFALPDLRGRTPVGQGQYVERNESLKYDLGLSGGREAVPLTAPNMPTHEHQINATRATADQVSGAGNYFAIPNENKTGVEEKKIYSGGQTVPLNLKAISSNGGDQPHANMQPFQVVNFAICVVGDYPPRSD